MNKLFEKVAKNIEFLELAKVSIGMATFVLLLLIPVPPFFSQIFHQADSLILIILSISFSLLFRKNGMMWQILQAILVFGLFAMPLIYKWQSANYDGNLIGGLLPWSDASGYYVDAYRLNIGLHFSDFATRRPLYTAFFSVLLRLTNGNLIITLACMTLVNTLAVFLAIPMVKRAYGSAAASIFLIFAFAFYERFAAKTLTEQLGFALGNLALFFLLAGIYTRRLWRLLLGLGLLTLALNARAGAFFILPTLILWIALYFGKKTHFLRIALLASVVVIIGFLLNLLLIKSIGSVSGAAFSNFPYVLYSLASGNTGWDQVIKDYPNVTESQVMPLAMQKIRRNPGLFIKGVIGAYGDYFGPYFGSFSFFYFDSIQRLVNIILWGCVVAGFVEAYMHRRDELFGLGLLSFVGIFISTGMAPPNISDSMRAFAATIPFTALWVAAGISAIATWQRGKFLQQGNALTEEIELPFQKLALGFSVLILALTIPAPLLLLGIPARVSTASASLMQSLCGIDSEFLQGVVFNDTSITLIRDDAARESYMPFIRISDFQNAIKSSGSSYPSLDKELLNLQAGNRVSFGVRLDESRKHSAGLWMISNFPVAGGEFSVCGHETENEQLQQYSFYYLKGISNQLVSLTFSQRNPTLTLAIRFVYGLGLGLVLFFLMTNIFGFKRYSLANCLYVIVLLFLISQGVLMGLYTQGKLPALLREQRVMLRGTDAIPEQGNLYMLPLGTSWMNQADLGISPARVYENGAPLPFPNSLHQLIRDSGNGRYSVWNGYLYFSTSDNSDPRTNGRLYEIRWPYPIPPLLQWSSYLLAVCSVAVWWPVYRRNIDSKCDS